MDRNFSKDDVRLLHTESVWQGFFRVLRYRLQHRTFAGGWSSELTRECFARGDSVGVLLYDPQRDLVGLVRQFRIGCLNNEQGPWVWEVLAGMVKPGETAAEVALREVQEECGLVLHAAALRSITQYYSSPGGTDERLTLYCALTDLNVSDGVYGLADEGEDILFRVLPAQQVFGDMLAGRINNAATVIALQWLQLNHSELMHEPRS